MRQPRLLVLSFWMLAASAIAQNRAVLRGQVTDESGAVVPEARVAVTGAQGQQRIVLADGQGRYELSELPGGTYTVTASAAGLITRHSTRIVVTAGTVQLNLLLALASLHENVTVEANRGPAVSTDSGSNANGLVLRGDDLSALSDDPDDLQADLQALAGPAGGPNGGTIFVDGFSGRELPAKNAIREIRINANPFSAEYDKLGYGRIEIFTNPGSEQYHATVDYNMGTDAWNSRNPYSAQRAPFSLNEFEGNGGGPLGKHASFTVDGQRNMVDNGFVIHAVTVDPSTFGVTQFTDAHQTPQTFTRVSPRLDFQLPPNHTLQARYGITRVVIDGAGIGGFDLVSRGYVGNYTNQTAELAETSVVGAGINETRFRFYRASGRRIAESLSPEIQVLGAFNGGGSQLGRSLDTQNTYELQNFTSTVRGAHSFRFGLRLYQQTDDSVSPQGFNGVFTFGGGLAPQLYEDKQPLSNGSGFVLAQITSVERYRRTLLFQHLGYTAAEIRELGGGSMQFSITAGNPALSVSQLDAAAFFTDEWRARPNLTVSLGLRYEAQTNIHDWRDIAPRVAVAWAPGGTRSRRKTVLRAGFGIFYDRFALSNTLAADRYNGIVQQQYVAANPDFFPNVPAPAALAAFQSTQATQRVSSTLRAPYIMQGAFTLERQILSSTTLALTYTNSHGLHELRSNDINAPLPGTFSPGVNGSGVYPLGRPGPGVSDGIVRALQPESTDREPEYETG